MYNIVFVFLKKIKVLLFFTHYEYPTISVNLFELLLIPFLFAIVYFYYKIFIYSKIEIFPHYKYFWIGLLAKMLSALAFCALSLTVYGGDTLEYYRGIQVLNALFYENPQHYFQILIYGTKPEYYSFFNSNSGWPAFYMWMDPNTFTVIRFFSVFGFFTFNSFLFTSLFASIIAYTGIWKLYSLFVDKYPDLYKHFAVGILFVPSVLYWGSGILKDTIIMFSLGWLLYSIHKVLNKKYNLKYFFLIIVSSIIIIIIKSYVFVVLLPTLAIWIFYDRTQLIKNKLVRRLSLPFFIFTSLVVSLFVLSSLSSSLGKYGNVDSMIEKARVTQEDLIRAELYGENSFYIGEIGNSPIELVSLAPKAIIAGLFRPFLWDARNPFMLISGIENFLVLILFVIIFFKRNVLLVFKLIYQDPFVLGMLIFVVFFAFGIGLSASNFGALVRYRIPLLPLFIGSLFIIRDVYSKKTILKA
jgi:hypothetical protein